MSWAAGHSILSFCSLLEANQWTWALTILSAMSSNSVEADVVTYNACVAACEKGSQWQQVLSLMGEMQMASVLANLITYNAAITACANVLVWLHTLCLLQHAEREQLQANVISYSEAVRACKVVTSYAPNLFDLLGGKSQADLSDLCSWFLDPALEFDPCSLDILQVLLCTVMGRFKRVDRSRCRNLHENRVDFSICCCTCLLV